jgi:hypothetical protein
MSIAGKFKTMPFTEQLQWLAQGQRTGTLVVDRGAVEKRLVFRNGQIISTSSNLPHEQLGHFLISHGFATEPQVGEVMRRQESSGKLFGKLLLDLGGIDEANLERMLRLKAEETLFEVFGWADGNFRFLDSELPESAMVPLQLNVPGLVLEAMQRLDESNRIREVVRSPQAVPVAVAALGGLGLEPNEELVLAAINDERTVEEICLETHSSEFLVSKVLFTQHQARRVKIVNPRAAATAALSGVDTSTLTRMAQTYLADGNYEAALRHLGAARSLDPSNSVLRATAEQAEARIRREVLAAGVVDSARPRLARPIEELMKLPLAPQDGFVLSRLNGDYEIRTILKISPMTPVETLVVLFRLKQAGHIEFDLS